MDPSDPNVPLDQAAIDSALQTYNQAAAQYNATAQNFDRLSNDPNADATSVNTASQQLDNTRTQLAQASRAYGDLLARVAGERAANARAAKDPNEQQLWASEAQKAQTQSDLYSAEASMYDAKTQAQIDNATTQAQAALQRAQNVAARVETQNQRDSASALLSQAKAAEVPALSASTIALHNSQIQLAGARAQQSLAYANRAQAQAQELIPAEAQKFLAAAGLSQAQIDALKITTPVKLKDLEAKAGLDDAKAQQILANIGKQQVLPYADTNAPNLDVFQPSTGQITGVQNPAYKNPYMQPLQDRAAAIEAIRNDLASGKYGTGPQAIDYANSLIDGISQQAQLAAQGFTPLQYQQTIANQAQIGENVLNNYMGILGKGSDVANTFLQYASRARNLPAGVNFNPFGTFGQIADQLYGPNIAKAQALIGQVQPVTDKFSALRALGQLSAVRDQIVQASGQTTTDQANPMNTSANPDVSANPAQTVAGVLPQQQSAGGMA